MCDPNPRASSLGSEIKKQQLPKRRWKQWSDEREGVGRGGGLITAASLFMSERCRTCFCLAT